ncbi:glyoxalase [Sphingomonas lenta]|uniref:Glyoxalase n=2 Tax=Sphingomonas lenta TaxID=1141887 RepID=A0A2A2SCZ1_9SPHN|nr:glyoxalase [Sphingomonas lenta]
MMALTLDHVQIAMPPGREDEVRAFFGVLLGLVEIDKPEALAGRGGCWFAAGERQLHLGVEADFRPARKAHVALATDELDALRARLVAAGRPIGEDMPIGGRRRFFTEDPFGNRLELIEREAGA